MRDIILQHGIVLSALEWVDTPYHHHARVIGAGVDCAQLIVAVALDKGIITPQQALDVPNYPTQWHLHNREEKLLQMLEYFGCIELDKADTQPGDIVCFQFGRTTSHLGIKINENEFIHARYDIGKVCINNMQNEWISTWTKSYAFPGVL